jgi:hypothetical protein
VIVRNPNASSHAIIDCSILRDCRLSWAARGVLAHLLAFDDAYEVLRVHLSHASDEERADVQNALAELEAHDYITFEDEVVAS